VIADALDNVTSLLRSPATRVYVVPVCALKVRLSVAIAGSHEAVVPSVLRYSPALPVCDGSWSAAAAHLIPAA